MSEEKILNLEKLNQKAVEEINRYKWIESEKKGHDIGDYTAAKEWIVNYYARWLEDHRDSL